MCFSPFAILSCLAVLAIVKALPAENLEGGITPDEYRYVWVSQTFRVTLAQYTKYTIVSPVYRFSINHNAFLSLRCPLLFGCARRCQRLAS